MSNTRRRPLLIGTMIVVGMGFGIPAAFAFNPQPDPPAKSRQATKTNPGDKNVIAPGLLDTSPGFSTNGPAATGTPLGGGAAGGARPGAAGIK